jgi:dipeptidyl aminopeptidase/acylaminoacyl peptidase
MKRLVVLILLLGSMLTAYNQPPKEITEIFDRQKSLPWTRVLKKHNALLLREHTRYLPMEELAREAFIKGGIEILKSNFAGKRSSYVTEFKIMDLETKEARTLNIPVGKYGSETMSYDERYFIFNEYRDDKIVLWLYDLKKDERKKLAEGLSQAISDAFRWMPDGKHVLVQLRHFSDSEKPVETKIPQGPVIYETSKKAGQLRTYPNLISSKHDEDLFEYYATTTPYLINIKSGKMTQLLEPAMYRSLDVSPDGKYFLCSTLDSISYKAPWWKFGRTYSIYNKKGKVVKTLKSEAPTINLVSGQVVTGPRYFYWDSAKPSTILATEALDGGLPSSKVEYRDQLLTFNPKKDKDFVKGRKLKHRYSGLTAIDEVYYIINEYDRENKWYYRTLYNVKTGTKLELQNSSVDDNDADLGSIFETKNKSNQNVPLVNDNKIYFTKREYAKDGIYPKIYSLNLETGEKADVWKSRRGVYEYCMGNLTNDMTKLLIHHESPTEYPNKFLYNDGKYEQVTDYVDPAPELTSLKKEFITYKRKDGLELSGMLYLPADHKKGDRLPLLFHAYPQEYTSKELASQKVNSENRFKYFWGSSDLYMCLNGFAVLKNANIAVVGDPETANDTFVEQISDCAQAAIDYLDSLEIIDPKRTAVTGHSYGAFMVANLLARTDIFTAGIAKNGAYNRTLTPFGFQSERRNFWNAKDIYFNISPFMFADKIDEPLLLIHSQGDTNPGTYPIQSKRLYQAIEGNGGNCRYVELPLEDHSYVTRETHLHLLSEYINFLNKYVKNRNLSE